MKKIFCPTLYSLFTLVLLTSCGKSDAGSQKPVAGQPGNNLTNFVEIPLVAPKTAPKAAPAAALPPEKR